MNQDSKQIEIVDGTKPNYSHFRLKSDLMVTMEALEPKSEPKESQENEEDAEVKLSRSEMIARAKELRLLRIRESQKSAKARLQNKIKSKKFHKILKKEKLKEQMKEFEKLQKEDPEAALRKLEQLEKHRVEERALLRHKNTGTWAKNLQVRSKYDKDARKELAQQLAISRELTQKQHDPEDDDDENANVEDMNSADPDDPFNPWLKQGKPGKISSDEITSDDLGTYRKYWNERNENEAALKEYRDDCAKDLASLAKETEAIQLPRVKNTKVKRAKGWTVEDCNVSPLTKSKKIKNKSTSSIDNIDDLFDDAEEVIRSKIATKLKEMGNNLTYTNGINSTRRNNKRSKGNHNDLSFKKPAKRPDIDEALNMSDNEEADRKAIEDLKKVSTSKPIKENSTEEDLDNINPDKFIKIKPKHLRTALPDMEGEFGESDDETGRANAKRLTIAEAFEDDDIVADFEQAREDERKKGEAEEINLTLPGWGSWAGSGINPNKKIKKLILKFPKEEKKREENKGNVIIVDNANKKLREHQVSNLPFPFTSVKDYEASIRAPIGNDFVPAVVHKLLTKPAITTELGAIIEPMQEGILMKRPDIPLTKTAKRIARVLAKATETGKKGKKGKKGKR